MKVIGIAGPSCSGKSTLADALRKDLSCEVIRLDEFYISDGIEVYIEKGGELIRSFERPELYDGNKIAEVLEELARDGESEVDIFDYDDGELKKRFVREEFVIVEGFLIYLYPDLTSLIDHKFYLDIDSETIIDRRINRLDRAADKNFLEVGIEEYRKFGVEQKQMDDVTVLDGKASVKTLRKQVVESLHVKA